MARTIHTLDEVEKLAKKMPLYVHWLTDGRSRDSLRENDRLCEWWWVVEMTCAGAPIEG